MLLWLQIEIIWIAFQTITFQKKKNTMRTYFSSHTVKIHLDSKIFVIEIETIPDFKTIAKAK